MAEKRAAAAALLDQLEALHPDAACELTHRDPFELLVATVLSAQTTDKMVNQVTPALFAAYPDARALAGAEQADVERLIARLGFFRSKAKNLLSLARSLCERHGGEVPRTLAELVALAGVGRKTANVVLGVAFGQPEGVVVDTHVQRLAQRLGLSKGTEPAQIERELVRLFDPSRWDGLSHVLIFHGRRVCSAQRPACEGCGVAASCPSAGRAEHVGRKPKRVKKSA